MNALLKMMFFLSLMIISSYSQSASKLVVQNVNGKMPFPNSINILLRDSLCEYVIPNEAQFDNEWKSYGHISTPMYVISDFNGDSRNDYAMLLLSKTEKKVLLIICLSNKKDNFFTIKKISTFDLNNNLIDIFHSVDKKGYWESISGKKYTKYDGIRVDWGSSSLSFSYYWKNNLFHKFTSD